MVVVFVVQVVPLYIRYTTESVPGPTDRLPILLSAIRKTVTDG